MANNLTLTCSQRKRQQLFNMPPVRVELQTSPYQQGYTQRQLDMRRKVEILKYNPILQGNQTNSLTKAERWAQIVNGATQRRSAVATPAGQSLCPDDDYLHIPTSSSDVPGPAIDLYLEDGVPLYNYIKTGDPYSELPPETPEAWSISFTMDNVANENSDNPLLSLFIRDIEDSTTYDTYTLRTPVCYSISGSCGDDVPTGVLQLSDNNFQFKMLYGTSDVLIETPIITFNPIDVNISFISPGPFRAKVFVGMLTVSNIVIQPQYRFIYDLYFHIDITTAFVNTVDNDKASYTTQFIVNPTSGAPLTTNCTTTSASSETFIAPTEATLLVKNS